MTANLAALEKAVKEAIKPFELAKKEMHKAIISQNELIDRLFIALLGRGHILLEGLPGLGKTLAVNTFSKVIQSQFSRVQFTPDLLPADLIGTTIYNPKENSFSVNKGPIFTNILLADEINRAPAKVQSALLEAMQERQITIGGQTFPLADPYLVLATQNPIEHEGTYPLPEAQTDRFMMKLKIDYPSLSEEKDIIRLVTSAQKPQQPQAVLSPAIIAEASQLVSAIYVDDKIMDYILHIVHATRDPKAYKVDITGLLLFGASPRASIALQVAAKARAFLAGRAYVVPHDVKQIAPDVLRHRLRRSYEAEAEDISADAIIQRILATLVVP